MVEYGESADGWRAVIRLVRGEESTVLGAGVLVSDRHVLTCAHVIGGEGPDIERPEGDLSVIFPNCAELAPRTAQIADGGWFPVSGSSNAGEWGNGDIAVLELKEPVSIPSAVLAPAAGAIDRKVSIYGHPAGAKHGVRVFARVSEKPMQGSDWVQLDPDRGVGQLVDRGFSGAAVVDTESGNVLGIAVAYFGRDHSRIAWMLPVETIERYWPKLRNRVEGARGVVTLEPAAAAVTTCVPWPDSHEVSAVTTQGRLLRRRWGRTTGWSRWYDAQAPDGVVAIATIAGDEGGMESVAADTYGRVHLARRYGERWHDWRSLGAPDEEFASPTIIQVAAASDSPGHGEIFGVTSAGELVHRWRRGGDDAPWSSWHALRTNTPPLRAVSAASHRPQGMYCVVVDVHGRCWRTDGGPDGWSRWHRLRLPQTTRSPAIARVTAASMREDHQEIFAVTTAGELIHRWQQDDGKWSLWSDFSTPRPVTDVAACAQSDGQYECVITDVDGRVWFSRFSRSTFWSGWTPFDEVPISGF